MTKISYSLVYSLIFNRSSRSLMKGYAGNFNALADNNHRHACTHIPKSLIVKRKSHFFVFTFIVLLLLFAFQKKIAFLRIHMQKTEYRYCYCYGESILCSRWQLHLSNIIAYRYVHDYRWHWIGMYQQDIRNADDINESMQTSIKIFSTK